MKKVLNNVILESENNISYFNDIVSYINDNDNRILNFFRLKKLSNKIIIRIVGFNEFKEYIISKYGEYRDYVRADTDKNTNTIMILALKDQIKYTKHKDIKFSSFLKLILHEFVHACNDEINSDYNQTIWFNEGIATNLSNHNYDIADLSNCDFESLKNNFNGNYKYAYTIVNYIINNYSSDETYKLVSDSNYLRKRSNEIFNEVCKNLKINSLLLNLSKIHTTKLGEKRIKRNLNIDEDVIIYCKNKLLKSNCMIYKNGKNWYCEIDNIIFTINSHSYTIITAHLLK